MLNDQVLDATLLVLRQRLVRSTGICEACIGYTRYRTLMAAEQGVLGPRSRVRAIGMPQRIALGMVPSALNELQIISSCFKTFRSIWMAYATLLDQAPVGLDAIESLSQSGDVLSR